MLSCEVILISTWFLRLPYFIHTWFLFYSLLTQRVLHYHKRDWQREIHLVLEQMLLHSSNIQRWIHIPSWVHQWWWKQHRCNFMCNYFSTVLFKHFDYSSISTIRALRLFNHSDYSCTHECLFEKKIFSLIIVVLELHWIIVVLLQQRNFHA